VTDTVDFILQDSDIMGMDLDTTVTLTLMLTLTLTTTHPIFQPVKFNWFNPLPFSLLAIQFLPYPLSQASIIITTSPSLLPSEPDTIGLDKVLGTSILASELVVTDLDLFQDLVVLKSFLQVQDPSQGTSTALQSIPDQFTVMVVQDPSSAPFP
jgi:hypothetical protein